MTQGTEQRVTDVPYTKLGGVKVDRTFTIANVIQICLILFATWMAGWNAYAKMSAVERMQQDLSEDLKDLQTQLVRQSDNVQAQIGIQSKRTDDLSNKVQASELDAAVSRNRVETLATAIDRLSQSIDRIIRPGSIPQ